MDMRKETDNSDEIDIDQIELEGFTRSVAEIEWLLLILILLYYVSPGVEFANPFGVFISIVVFATFVLTFHYVNFFTIPSRWKIAIETWVMILFISWVIWSTGDVDSPLLSLYILVIIASALTLGKLITFLELALIAAMYFYLSYPAYSANEFTVNDFSRSMTVFVPILLIAYVTTMLATDVQHGKQALKLLSERDDMTGLKNKRSFKTALMTEFNTAVRYARTFSIVMIDADNLKQVNDSYGHGAGDRLIELISSAIEQSLRTSDVIARYGGDEFVVLMPETNCQAAKEAAEKIRLAIQNSAFDMRGERVTTTVSVGVSGFPEDSNNINALMDCADEALYASKKAGRNKVTSFSEVEVKAA
jgi:diguanylate cyclase (GGDEF)-like protein